MNTATLTYTISAPSFEAFKEEVIKLYTQLVGVERLARTNVAGGQPAIALSLPAAPDLSEGRSQTAMPMADPTANEVIAQRVAAADAAAATPP